MKKFLNNVERVFDLNVNALTVMALVYKNNL